MNRVSLIRDTVLIALPALVGEYVLAHFFQSTHQSYYDAIHLASIIGGSIAAGWHFRKGLSEAGARTSGAEEQHFRKRILLYAMALAFTSSIVFFTSNFIIDPVPFYKLASNLGVLLITLLLAVGMLWAKIIVLMYFGQWLQGRATVAT